MLEQTQEEKLAAGDSLIDAETMLRSTCENMSAAKAEDDRPIQEVFRSGCFPKGTMIKEGLTHEKNTEQNIFTTYNCVFKFTRCLGVRKLLTQLYKCGVRTPSSRTFYINLI